jgi:SAM-dependent methyltransferase
MGVPYDAGLIAAVFDEYADAEWSRHEETPSARVAFDVHRRHLERFVERDSDVLEIGAGAGRFTIELARLGAHITVGDISPGQLELNERHVEDAGLDEHVAARVVADIIDLSRFGDGAFDTVVCFGGPLSWVLAERDRAIDELLRVTRSDGHVLLSVMSRFGSLHAFLAAAADEIERFGLAEMEEIVRTGFLPPPHSTLGPMHLFTWDELEASLRSHRCQIVTASATNFLSIGNDGTCERWLEDPVMWKRFLDWEADACARPGALDGGTHILVVVRPT